MAARFEVALIRMIVGMIATGALLLLVASTYLYGQPGAANNGEFIGRPLHIIVLDKGEMPITDASVHVVSDMGEGSPLYNIASESYVLSGFAATSAHITVNHPEYLPEARTVSFDNSGLLIVTIYLGQSGDSFTYRYGKKYPYVSHPDLLGILIHSRDRGRLDSVLKELKLSIQDEIAEHIFVVKRGQACDQYNCSELRTLRSIDFIRAAGPILTRSERNVYIFTNRIIVEFTQDVNEADARSVLEAEGLLAVEPRWGAPNQFNAVVEPGMGEGMNDILHRLMDRKEVVSAFPELAYLPRTDSQ